MTSHTPSLILGSGSPRRAEILRFFRIPFQVVASTFDEDTVPWEEDPAKYVETMCRSKSRCLLPNFPHQTLLCADTAVVLGNKVFNKPRSTEEAEEMLRALAGRWHSVWTGVSVRRGTMEWHGSQETRLLFLSLSREQIRQYQRQVHTLDKAGGYAIQGAGSMVVDKIDGCFYNVMGLPLRLTTRLLGEGGIDLWQHLGSS